MHRMRVIATTFLFAILATPWTWAQGSTATEAGPPATSTSASPATEPLGATASRRRAILDVAEQYATHEWRATEANVFHGTDDSGARVDTPDETYTEQGWQPGRVNVGVPYKWGGFSSLEQFDRGVEQGLYAGHIPKSGASPSTARAVGVDCSGFVARCWDLPFKQSTRSLGRLCHQLDSYQDLQPGDLINKFDAHAMIFAGFADDERTQVRVYEAAFPCVLERSHPIELLEGQGFLPMRYKPLDERWSDIEQRPATFSMLDEQAHEVVLGAPDSPTSDDVGAARRRGRWIADTPAAEAPVEVDGWAHPLAAAQPGEWAGFRVAYGGSELVSTVTRIVAAVEGGQVEVQSSTAFLGRQMQTAETHDLQRSFVDALLDVRDSGQRLEDIAVVSSVAEPGRYLLGGREFPARRMRIELSGGLTSRGTKYPLQLVIDAVRCDDVPLQGLLAIDFETRIDYGDETGLSSQHYELVAFHERAPAPAPR